MNEAEMMMPEQQNGAFSLDIFSSRQTNKDRMTSNIALAADGYDDVEASALHKVLVWY